ncbi:hypothetical protein OJF2_44770 [Aquisphaera giovannonii]|uniref:PEP-CTERM protein-sorting domain-containing protein n=1 Tax=Aquisphaera giovannonii TaxID=406548 RepID=A0A5B9W7M2_9BACT|nr:hypothetical protein [Aquisphaera giovannonii]QEH35920.1 hypothetical protein OJF2_44770 [Aquisphaera giovannonii]
MRCPIEARPRGFSALRRHPPDPAIRREGRPGSHPAAPLTSSLRPGAEREPGPASDRPSARPSERGRRRHPFRPWALLGCLLLVAPPLRAESITYCAELNGRTQPDAVPQFGGGRGSLERVELIWTVTVSGEYQSSGPISSYTISPHARIDLLGDEETLSFDSGPAVPQAFDVADPRTVTSPSWTCHEDILIDDLSPYIGPGLFRVQVSGGLDFSADTAFDLTSPSVTGSLSITYTYLTAAAPEPPAVAMLALALAIVIPGWYSRSRARHRPRGTGEPAGGAAPLRDGPAIGKMTTG